MVGHSFSAYERELRCLLEGDRSAVLRYSKSIPPIERADLERVVDEPFLVVRGAGSLGFDLVAMRGGLALPVEVKASSEPTIHFTAASGRAAEQLEAHRVSVERVGLVAVYAYRKIGHRNGDSWRLFSAARQPQRGLLGLLARRLPPVERTREGNAVLRWDHGMPLIRFLSTVHTLFEPVALVSP
ncbi:MAG: Holliday junction resolvase [Thermoplasmata archaeon]|nr:Holliday junction resolvase [Thermoplasmata archaeon]